MKKILSALTVLLMASTAFAASQFYSPTQLSYHNPDTAYQGYTLFHSMNGDQTTFLIDMEGQVVHTWPMDADKWSISNSVHLYKNGLLLRTQTPQYVGRFKLGSSGGNPSLGTVYKFLDWENNEVYSVRHPLHKDPTEAELQHIFGLTDAQMKDQSAINAAVKAITAAQKKEIAELIDYREHHDARMVWNKKLGKYTIMFIANKKLTREQVLNAGQNPDIVDVKTVSSYPNHVDTDVIAEVDIQTGKLLWQWWSGDHLIQNYDATADNYAQDIAGWYYGGDLKEAHYRRLDINHKNNQGISGLREDFFHTNSFDYNSERDEVVLNSRSFSEFYVIDHSKTTEELKGPAGDFKWRFGSPCNYASEDQLGKGHADAVPYPGARDASLDQIYGAHDIHWIPEGLPGAGHFMIYDNGIFRPVYQNSAVLEINPYDANGNYIRELDAGYKASFKLYPGAVGTGTNTYGGSAFSQTTNYMKPSNLITWAFTSNSWNFYGPHISGAQRQPNGNTLICDGPNGHFFEVTTEGQVVWEYTSPLHGSPIGATTNCGLTSDGKEIIGGSGLKNSVFRAYKYSPNFAGFSGKALVPMGTVVEYIENNGEPSFTGFGFGGGIGGSGGGSGGGGGGGSGY